MFTGLDVYTAKVTVEERRRKADLDRLVREAIQANRTQPGVDLRLLNLFSRILTYAGQALVHTGERIEHRYQPCPGQAVEDAI